MNITWKQWITIASNSLNTSLSPKLDAEVLLKHVIKVSNARIFAFGETKLTNHQYDKLNSLLIRRIHGEPIAYIIGEKEFWSLVLFISKDTIIPRPDTECLIEEILSLPLPFNAKILDVGTGTGAIALALAYERCSWIIRGIDNKLGALSVAKLNQCKLGIKNIKFSYGNWFLWEKKNYYDLIVSNPPYIDINDDCLNQGDVRFEPRSALVADNNGLAYLSLISYKARDYLNNHGWLMLEHGYNQGSSVRKFLSHAGFSYIKTKKDFSKKERLSFGKKI